LLPAAEHDRLFAGSQPREIVMQWHGDTFDLPPGAVLLAQTATCANQAFRYGTSAYGLQFHLEITGEMVLDWLDTSGLCAQAAAQNNFDADAIRQRAPEELRRSAPFVERIFGRFGDLCHAWIAGH
jgi:GMP synthase (glutamine-hydrolysing)